MYIGYARVSTEGQNIDMQIDALKQAGCKKIFYEKVSGVKVERKEFDKAWKYLRDGEDTLVIYKLDRMSRSLKHLIDLVCKLEERRIELKSLSESIDTSTAIGKLVFHVFSAVAECERELIRERTLKGLEAARARGRRGGPKRKLTEEQMLYVKKLYSEMTISTSEICGRFNISPATFYRIVRSC